MPITLPREELFAEICAQLIEGKSLRKICLQPEMPGLRTVMTWLNEREDFQQQYARARELQADTLAEEILDIADDGSNDTYVTQGEDGEEGYERTNHEVIARSRLRVDARKWYAGKLAPKKYGDKMELSGNQESPLTVQIVKLADDDHSTSGA